MQKETVRSSKLINFEIIVGNWREQICDILNCFTAQIKRFVDILYLKIVTIKTGDSQEFKIEEI